MAVWSLGSCEFQQIEFFDRHFFSSFRVFQILPFSISFESHRFSQAGEAKLFFRLLTGCP